MSKLNTLNPLSLVQLQSVMEVAINSNTVLLIQGSPGVGKSDSVFKVADKLNYRVIDVRLTQLQVYDLMGLPKVDKVTHADGTYSYRSTYASMDVFPLEGDSLGINPKTGKEYEGVILFLDELTSADKATQVGAYRLILDREVGNGEKLHPKCRIICAGNKATDMAVTHKLSTALKSRMIHVEVKPNVKEFSDYVLSQVSQGLWHPLILGFISYLPIRINDFDPKEETVTFSCPRTLEMLSDLLLHGDALNLPDYILDQLVIGTIGKPAGLDFIAFKNVLSTLPKIADIVAKPTKAIIPTNNGAQYALGAYIANAINESNEEALVTYLLRLERKELIVLAIKMIQATYPMIVGNQRINTLLTDLASTLYA